MSTQDGWIDMVSLFLGKEVDDKIVCPTCGEEVAVGDWITTRVEDSDRLPPEYETTHAGCDTMHKTFDLLRPKEGDQDDVSIL